MVSPSARRRRTTMNSAFSRPRRRYEARSSRAWLHDRRQAPRRASTLRLDKDGRAWWHHDDLSSSDRLRSSESAKAPRWPRPVIWRFNGRVRPLCKRSEFYGWLITTWWLTLSPWRQADVCGGFYGGKNDHAAFRTTLQRLIPNGKEVFLVYSSRGIVNSPSLKKMVFAEFKLPLAATKFVADYH